jgi:hypothetical protein
MMRGTTGSYSVLTDLEVKMKPERGGVTRLPAPHPMKKIEESRPVTFVFFATQEKQEPNCHEMKNPGAVLHLVLHILQQHRTICNE